MESRHITDHPESVSRYFEINLTDIDVGIHWYEDGLIGGYRFGQAISPEAAADELPTSQDTSAAVLCLCFELGITQAKAFLYHQDADLHVSNTFRLHNGLPYPSVFENGRPQTRSARFASRAERTSSSTNSRMFRP